MKRFGNFTIGIFVFSSFFSLYSAQTGDDAVQLHAFLFNSTGYNRRVRPVNNQTHPVQINFILSLSSIQELDSAAQKLSVVGILNVNWRDEFLTWNKTAYGDIASIMAFQNEVWRPQLFIGSPLDDFTEVGFSTITVRITDAGVVTWSPPGVFTFRCTVDIRYYPFDTQNCYLQFGTKDYTTNEITLMSFQEKVNLANFEKHVEWELLSATSEIQLNTVGALQTQVFRNTLKLKRRSTFLIIHSLAPVILLSILNILVFALPAESGEKISLSITLFLAFAIFLTLLSESLPKNSLTLPIFSVYLILINIMSTLYVILTVVVLNIYHKSSDDEIPLLIRSLIIRCQRPICSCKVEHKDDLGLTESPSKQDAGIGQYSKHKENDQCIHNKVTWVDVSRFLDITFAVIFSILLVVSTLIFGIILGAGS